MSKKRTRQKSRTKKAAPIFLPGPLPGPSGIRTGRLPLMLSGFRTSGPAGQKPPNKYLRRETCARAALSKKRLEAFRSTFGDSSLVIPAWGFLLTGPYSSQAALNAKPCWD